MDSKMDSTHKHQSKKIKLEKTEENPVEQSQSPINYMLLLQNHSKKSYIPNEIDYNSIDKVKCTITNSYYLSDLEEYFTYYYLCKKIFIGNGEYNGEHNGKIHDLTLNLISSRKIFYVTKIYFDYPYNITITIQNNNDNIGDNIHTIEIYRFLVSKFLNIENPHRNLTSIPSASRCLSEIPIDEILKNDCKIKYLSIDLYNSIEIINNILIQNIINKDKKETKDYILFELGKDNLEKSKYTDTKINNLQYTDMVREIFNILNTIPVKYQ